MSSNTRPGRALPSVGNRRPHSAPEPPRTVRGGWHRVKVHEQTIEIRQIHTCLLASDAALAVRLGGKFSSLRSAGCPEAWRLLTRRAPLPNRGTGCKSGACYARADARSESRLLSELRGNQTASSGGPLVDFVVGGHQGEAFPFGEPDINRVGCAQPPRDGHALNPLRTLGTNRRQRGVRKKAADKAVHLSRRKKPARASAEATSIGKIAGTTMASLPLKSGDRYATDAA